MLLAFVASVAAAAAADRPSKAGLRQYWVAALPPWARLARPFEPAGYTFPDSGFAYNSFVAFAVSVDHLFQVVAVVAAAAEVLAVAEEVAAAEVLAVVE